MWYKCFLNYLNRQKLKMPQLDNLTHTQGVLSLQKSDVKDINVLMPMHVCLVQMTQGCESSDFNLISDLFALHKT